jgi:hypothetical protein
LSDFISFLTGMFRHDIYKHFLHFQNLFSLDLDIGGLSFSAS